MIRVRVRFVFLFLGLLPTLHAVGQPFHADQFRGSGLNRPADVLRLFDDRLLTTLDGFSWQMSATGLPPLQGPAWTLSIDDRPVFTAPFETPNLNGQPLISALMDSVHTEGHTIQIRTSALEKGWTAGGQAMFGNATGDPGPLRYTARASPNVDKMGPDYEAWAGWAGTRGGVRAGLAIREDVASDPEVFDRVSSLSPRFPKQQVMAPTVEGRVNGLGGHHRFHLSRSDVQDYFFFTPLSREIPIQRTETVFHVQSLVPVTRRMRLHVRGTWSALDLKDEARGDAVRLDWQEHRTEVEAGGAYHLPRLHLDSGLRFSRQAAEDPLDPRRVVTAFGHLVVTEPIHQSLNLTLSTDAGERAMQVGWTGRIGLTAYDQLSLTATLDHSRFADEQPLLYWHFRGAGYLRVNGIDVLNPTEGSGARWLALRGRWRRSGPRTGWELETGYRHVSDLTLTRQPFDRDTDGLPTVTPLTVYPNRSGGWWTGRLVFLPVLPSGMNLRVAYHALRPLGDDPVFREMARSHPRHRAVSTLSLQPDDRLSLWVRTAYQTTTEWQEYGELDGFWTMDVAFGKRFWNEHLHASLLIRDIWNQRPRYHPLGAPMGLRFFLRVQAEW